MSHKRNDNLSFVSIKIRRSTLERWEKQQLEIEHATQKRMSRAEFIDQLVTKQERNG